MYPDLGIPGDSHRVSENAGESHRKAKKGMDVRTMKHAAKLAEWSEKVQACRTSGLPVKEWCEQNNVCSKTYYTWEREYLAEVSKQPAIPEQMPAAGASQIVRVDPRQMPDEMEAVGAASAVQATSNVKITLRYGGMSVEMPAGMEITQIAVLMKALGQTSLTSTMPG